MLQTTKNPMDYQFLKGRSVKMTPGALKKIDNPSTRKACLDYFPIFGAPKIKQVWSGNPDTNRNVCDYNLTENHSTGVYIRLSWSRKDSWWLNLDDVIFVSEQPERQIPPPKYKKGDKIAIIKELADRYGLEGHGTVVMCLSWEEFISGDDKWFRGAGNLSIQITHWVYLLNTSYESFDKLFQYESSNKFFPEESLALVTNPLVDSKAYNHMTGTLEERSRRRKFCVKLIGTSSDILQILKNVIGQYSDIYEIEIPSTNIFKAVSAAITESVMKIQAINGESHWFEVEHIKMLRKCEVIVTPSYFKINFKFGKYSDFRVEYTDNKWSLKIYGDVIAFVTLKGVIYPLAEYLKNDYFEHNPEYLDKWERSIMCLPYDTLVDAKVEKIKLDSVNLKKWKYKEDIHFKSESDVFDRLRIIPSPELHKKDFERVVANITGKNFCLSLLSNRSCETKGETKCETLVDIVKFVPYVEEWWKEDLLILVMKETGFYMCLRIFQMMKVCTILDDVTIIYFSLRSVNKQYRNSKILINELKNRSNMLKRKPQERT